MVDFTWLISHRFKTLVRYEYSWTFTFSGEVCLVATCLWRLLENGYIRLTREDDGHKFGLPAPLDVVMEVNALISGASITAVELREGTLDLDIHFESGHVLQIVPDSSGYEAWDLTNRDFRIIAVGGGNIATFDQTA